jgi:Protein of unknown function (DUF1036)
MLYPDCWRIGAWVGTCLITAALLSAAVAQPPKPGGSGGGAPSAPVPDASPPGAAPGGAGPGPGPGGAGPGAGPGGPGATPSPTFTLRMCNKSEKAQVIFVATISMVGQDQFRAQGWTQVPQGQCVPVGSHQRPAVWYHGRAPDGTFWASKPDAHICVNLNGGFDYSFAGGQKNCGQDQVPVPFMRIVIEPKFNNFTMNMN